MVEHSLKLDLVFSALSDGTRRDILKRVLRRPLSVSELAKPYDMSFAAIAKHVEKLERAFLVTKHRHGRQQLVAPVGKTIDTAATHLGYYQKLWDSRFETLEDLLQQ